MRIFYEYSHLGGKEILQVRLPKHWQEIQEIITAVRAERTKISQEQGRRGKPLFSPTSMNAQFKQQFQARGWHELKDRFDLELPDYPSPQKLQGSKQVDFAKSQVLAEVQFGKYAFMFYGLAKFQYFYNESQAEVAVEIVPAKPLQAQMSSGVAYGEQLVHDILRLRRHFPAVPVWVVLIVPDENQQP